jgi:hypothetical protein
MKGARTAPFFMLEPAGDWFAGYGPVSLEPVHGVVVGYAARLIMNG